MLDLIYLSSDHRAAVVEDGNKCIFFFCCCRGFFLGGVMTDIFSPVYPPLLTPTHHYPSIGSVLYVRESSGVVHLIHSEAFETIFLQNRRVLLMNALFCLP